MQGTGLDDLNSKEISHGRFLAAHEAERIWGWDTPAGRLRAERRAALICKAARLGPGVKCLEIGCGSGLFTEQFLSTGAEITAVDISPDLLALAQRRIKNSDKVRFVENSFEEVCDVGGPFDAIIGSSILHHLDIDASVKRIFHFLKPGGRMGFAEPNMCNPQILFQKNIPYLKERLGDSPDERAFFRWPLYRLMRKVGFESITILPFDWLHPNTPKPFIQLMKRVSYIFESLPGIREFSGSLLIKARRPS